PKKSKKKGAKADTPPPAEETPEEIHERKTKEVLGLRHRLQRGFLTRDSATQRDEMGAMDVYLMKLEDYSDLDAEMIKRAKINKVLKMIGKLRTIPEDEKYNFRERAVALFEKCNKLLSDAGEGAEKGSAEPEKKDDKEVNGSEEATAEKEEAEEKKDEAEDKMEEDTEEKKDEEAADKAE